MTTTKTFRQMFLRSLLRNVFVVLALALTVVVGVATEKKESTERPEVTNSPAALMEANDCWEGEAPADVVLPGHVVVTVDGQSYYAGPAMVSKALDQIFSGADYGLKVHGFCR